MLGASCSPCCAPQAGFVGLTLGGFKNFLHCYNTATSFNALSPTGAPFAVGPYLDNQPIGLAAAPAPWYGNSAYGPSCHGGSNFGTRNKICYQPLLTFTSTEVRLYLKFTVYYGADTYTCEVEYRKPRIGFWEEKYGIGIFRFTNADVFSLASDSDKFVISDIGTAAIVQRVWPAGQGVEWLNTWQYPLRVEVTEGASDIAGPYDFPDSSQFFVGRLIIDGRTTSAGLTFRLENSFFGMRVLVLISRVFWEAFHSGSGLTISGMGKPYLPWPGAVASPGGFDELAVNSTVVFTLV